MRERSKKEKEAYNMRKKNSSVQYKGSKKAGTSDTYTGSSFSGDDPGDKGSSRNHF